MGPRAGLGGCPPEFDPRAVQPVASRYTDYPIRCNNRVNTLNLGRYYTVIYPRIIKTEKSSLNQCCIQKMFTSTVNYPNRRFLSALPGKFQDISSLRADHSGRAV